jgi:hypothetical protein
MVKRDSSDVLDGPGDFLAWRHLAPQHHQYIDIRARFRIAASLRSKEDHLDQALAIQDLKATPQLG